MKRFKYKAKDEKGSVVEGEVEAPTDKQAAELVRKRNLVVISIKPVRTLPLDFLQNVRNRVSGGDVANFTRQLATMINAGLPLTEALVILRGQSKGGLQTIVGEILANVEEGEALSAAMGKHPDVFSKTYVALVRSGEVGGVLDEVLVRLADTLEKQREFKGKVKGALIYPAIIVAGMVVVAFIMMVFVIPRMTSLYDQFPGAELPVATKVLIGISDFVVGFWPVILILAGVLVWGFKLYRKTSEGRRKTDDLLFKMPLVGDLQRQVVLTELTRTLSLMTSSGVAIIEALNISSEVVGNTIVSDALKDSAKMVEKGFPIAFAFSRHPEAFPFILSQMIAVGEETGQIDEVLGKVSHVFEVESEEKLKSLTAAVEPTILIFLGVGVAFLVIAIIMPIYNLTTQI